MIPELKRAQDSLAELVAKATEQAAQIEAAQSGLVSFEESMGDLIISGSRDADKVADELIKRRAKIETMEAAGRALQAALVAARDRVRDATITDYRAQAAEVRAELLEHSERVTAVLDSLREIEETPALRVECYAAPVPRSGHRHAKFTYLVGCADRLASGLPILPYQEPQVAALPT